MGPGNVAKRSLKTVFPVTGRTKWRAEPGKPRDNQGLRGAHRPAHWPVIAWPPPSRWPGSEEGATSREVPPPWGEAQLPPRSGGTFLIIVITAISRSGDNRVLASRLCLQTQPHGHARAREGPLRAGVLSPLLQMWMLRSSGIQDTHSKGSSWAARGGTGCRLPSDRGSKAWCGHPSSGRG